MKNVKGNMRHVFFFFFFLLCLIIADLLKLVLVDRNDIISNPYNTRLTLVENVIKRGDIFSSDGNILATSVSSGDGFVREYPYASVFAHVVGYSSKGKTGIEAICNSQLQVLHNEIFQRFLQVFTKNKLKGNSVELTINSNLQNDIYEAMKDSKGAFVAIEPSTGKVLAMVSIPDFNPNELNADWETLTNDSENSPLLNRATQGLYPPGSTFKIVTSVAGIENIPDFTNFEYNCTGEALFGENKIRCYNSEVHGNETYYNAMAESCNTFFSTIGTKVGASNLTSVAEKFYFNKTIPFDLPYSISQFPMKNDSSVSELIETSIGQGKIQATPLQMALITETIANNGIMMKPYIVDHYTTYSGKSFSKFFPSSMGQIIPSSQAEIVQNGMREVIISGTGMPVNSDKYEIAGKTGTAENSAGADHGWFVAYAPYDNPKIAISVITENSDGTRKLLPKVKKIIENYLDSVK